MPHACLQIVSMRYYYSTISTISIKLKSRLNFVLAFDKLLTVKHSRHISTPVDMYKQAVHSTQSILYATKIYVKKVAKIIGLIIPIGFSLFLWILYAPSLTVSLSMVIMLTTMFNVCSEIIKFCKQRMLSTYIKVFFLFGRPCPFVYE